MNVCITVNSLDVQIDDVQWKGKLPKIGETIDIKSVVPPENYHSYHKYIVEECTQENLNKVSSKLGKPATPWKLTPIEKKHIGESYEFLLTHYMLVVESRYWVSFGNCMLSCKVTDNFIPS